MAEQRPYPSDLSDARWELIEPVLTAAMIQVEMIDLMSHRLTGESTPIWRDT
ncbi:hypothetical protein AB0M95_30250 [Sphaerisporangium sp. NPDC051017]|uniref:hypothetical protein n=1 Tax=Sphaerisporangium sp. NPDC051017 TaxID=3154636 RepID=UPI003413E833